MARRSPLIAPLFAATSLAFAAGAQAQEAAPPAPAAPVKAACKPVVLGAPVSAIRSFLSHAAAAPATPAPWLGIRGEPETSGNVHGVRVVAVAPSSPAAGVRHNFLFVLPVEPNQGTSFGDGVATMAAANAQNGSEMKKT